MKPRILKVMFLFLVIIFPCISIIAQKRENYEGLSNYNESQAHSFIFDEVEANKWILSRLSTNPNIATINPNGILTAKGKGICFVEAYNNGVKYSMPIVVGTPRYIIEGYYSPGGYSLKAVCIDDEFKNSENLINDAFKFKWGIKYGNNPLEWIESSKPEFFFKQTSDNEYCVCFLEVLNNQGERLSMQNMDISSKNIYDIKNSTFYIDRNGTLYDGIKDKYDFDYASIYFSRKKNLSKIFDDSSWDAISALSIDPIGKYKDVSIDEESITLKDMFAEDAIEYMKEHSEEGQQYIYTIVLLNYENKPLQYIPIRIIYESVINK